MSDVFKRILDLVARQEVLVSEHGYDELAADDILIEDAYSGIRTGPELPHAIAAHGNR